MTSSTRRRGRFGTEPPSTGAAAQDAEPDQESVARAIALRLLTSSPRSRAQLAEAMARKDVPDEVAERVLDRFTEVGLIDDAEYARMVVRTRHAERGLSRRAIAVELRRRGIDDELAGDALEQVDADDEESAARTLVRRKLASTSGAGRADAVAADVRGARTQGIPTGARGAARARGARRPGRRRPTATWTGSTGSCDLSDGSGHTGRTPACPCTRTAVAVRDNGRYPRTGTAARTCGRTRRTLWTQAPSARSSGCSAPASWPSCSSSSPVARPVCSGPARRRTSPPSRTRHARCATDVERREKRLTRARAVRRGRPGRDRRSSSAGPAPRPRRPPRRAGRAPGSWRSRSVRQRRARRRRSGPRSPSSSRSRASPRTTPAPS